MNVKTWAPLLLAVMLGLMAMIFAKKMSSSQPAAAVDTGVTKVVTARNEIPAGAQITEENLKLVEFKSDTVPAESFTDTAKLSGRVAQVRIAKDQMVAETLLAPDGSGMGLQALIPAGMRAITIEVNEFSSVAGMIVPGCHVDVLATINSEGEMTSRTIAQNILVTAIGQKITPPSKNGEEQPPYRSVTLMVTPPESETLELCAASARPRLILRGGRDASVSQTYGATMSDLRGRHHRPSEAMAMVKPTTSPSSAITTSWSGGAHVRTVKIIRAGAESEIQFDVADQTDSSTMMTGNDTEPVLNK